MNNHFIMFYRAERLCHEYQFAHIVVVNYIRLVFFRIVLISVTTDVY